MAHNHEEEIDYESLPAGSSMAINMFAGAMVSAMSSLSHRGATIWGERQVRGARKEIRLMAKEVRNRGWEKTECGLEGFNS